MNGFRRFYCHQQFQDALMFYNDVVYHEYKGISLDLDERNWLAEHLGDMLVMIMNNHGLLTIRVNVAQAFVRMHNMERSCQVQIDARPTGRELHPLSEDLCMRMPNSTNKVHLWKRTNGMHCR